MWSTPFTASFSREKSISTELIESVMKDVYGDWTTEDGMANFPKPMPANEAGPSKNRNHENPPQRRYLWTDAFGVLNFISMFQRQEQEDYFRNTPPEREEEVATCSLKKRKQYLQAAEKLAETVHYSLGNPREETNASGEYLYPMESNSESPWGYSGLRIGKVHARKDSDPGMRYDGMYWHYLDKWIFALYRLYGATRNVIHLEEALSLIKQVHPHFIIKQRGKAVGFYWKVNVDMSPISGLKRTGPSDDALTALIVYSLVSQSLGSGALDGEIAELKQVLERYPEIAPYHVSSDPLGWGLKYWEIQWFDKTQYWTKLVCSRLSETFKDATDIRSGMLLPFRLYGALIGAQVSGNPTFVKTSRKIIDKVMPIECSTNVGEGEHTTINKVMFVSAVCPHALFRQHEEVQIVL